MPKKRNEATSKRVASIAGKVLDRLASLNHGNIVAEYPRSDGSLFYASSHRICTIGELKALAASALTQREDRVGYATLTTEIDGHRQTSKQPVVSNTIVKKVTFRKPPKRKPARKGRK